MEKLCTVCGSLMIVVDDNTTHPSCDPRFAPDLRREMIRAANTRKGRDGKKRALRNDPQSRAVGLSIIRRAAEHLPWLSADDVRDDLEAAEIPRKQYGGLWSTAEARGWVEQADEVVSGGESAHGKKINRYRSRLYRGAA